MQILKWDMLKIPPPNMNWRVHYMEVHQPFLEFLVLPRATMNESEHINFFARHEFYIFSECKFSRDVNVNLVEV